MNQESTKRKRAVREKGLGIRAQLNIDRKGSPVRHRSKKWQNPPQLTQHLSTTHHSFALSDIFSPTSYSSNDKLVLNILCCKQPQIGLSGCFHPLTPLSPILTKRMPTSSIFLSLPTQEKSNAPLTVTCSKLPHPSVPSTALNLPQINSEIDMEEDKAERLQCSVDNSSIALLSHQSRSSTQSQAEKVIFFICKDKDTDTT